MSILSIRNLKVNYHTQEGAVQAVDGVSLDLDESQRLGLIGESGCGKTTLLKAIVQVLPRNGHIVSGEIKFKGMDLLKLPPAEMRQLRWREIATIPQASMDSLNPVQRVGSQLMKLLRVRGGYTKKGGAQTGGRSLRHGRLGYRALDALSARILRRHEAARRHRYGAGA